MDNNLLIASLGKKADEQELAKIKQFNEKLRGKLEIAKAKIGVG